MVVGSEVVDSVDLDMRAALADPAVAARDLAPVELVRVTSDADHEHVEACQEACELLAPARELDDVLNDQVVPRRGQGRKTAVEAVEEARLSAVLVERAVLFAEDPDEALARCGEPGGRLAP